MKISVPITELVEYLNTTLGLDVVVGDLIESGLPFFVRDRYVLRGAEILGRKSVLIFPRDAERVRPQILQKDMERIREASDRMPIWVSLHVDAYERRKLIESRVSFVVPRFQAYLPELLLDAREHFPRLRSARAPNRFSPATQQFFLEALYSGTLEIDHFRPKQAVYSAMSRSRAISELEASGLLETEMTGRNRRASFHEPREQVWEKALPLLNSPVKRCVYLTDRTQAAEKAPKAGFTALADLSMLTPPRLPVYAQKICYSKASPDWWEPLVTPHVDEARAQLQLWSYRPLKEKAPIDCVDRLSLYLSLKDQDDSRTQEALSQLVKEAL